MKGQPPKSRSPLYSAALLLILLSAGYFAYSSFGPQAPPTPEAAPKQAPAPPPAAEPSPPLPGGFSAFPLRGSPQGMVTVEEFSDFQCPFCARSVPILKQLLAEFPGRVRWIFRHFPVPSSHPNAPFIHLAVSAAGKQGRFWEMHDTVFENRERVSLEDILGYARGLGLDMAAFEASLKDRALMDQIEADYNEGIDRMVRATPTFFINGKKVEGAVPYPLFKREVELAIARLGRSESLPGAEDRS